MKLKQVGGGGAVAESARKRILQIRQLRSAVIASVGRFARPFQGGDTTLTPSPSPSGRGEQSMDHHVFCNHYQHQYRINVLMCQLENGLKMERIERDN
jgi:hypothetical protein